MIRTPTLKTVPFGIMRPALKTLMASTLMVLSQVEVDDKLAIKIFALRDKTKALENPTRHHMQTHLAAWYGVGIELTEAIDTSYPEFAGLLRNVLKEADWIEPAWLYMKGQMEQWQTERSV